MNDFDFEELDKAVGALASKTRDEHGSQEPIVPAALKITSSNEPAAAAPRIALSAAPAPVSSPEPQPVRSQPDEAKPVFLSKHRLNDTRPRGRGAFMDIVPPTSSSRKTPTRVGVSVQPVSSLDKIVPENGAEEANKDEPSPAGKTPELSALPQKPLAQPETTDEHAQPKSVEPQAPAKPESADTKGDDDVAWPDPLDFGAESAKQKPAEEPADEPTEPVSPFLAEAKVSKRPLGAFSNFKPVDEPKSTDEPANPDELTPEADGVFQEPEKAPLPPKEGVKPEEKPPKPDLHETAMMAIPDQYRPGPKQADKTPRPVYDTKEYHPPLIEATGHHEHRGGGSVWGKIFVALVALALIAVGGYFAYIYFVQQ